MFIKKSKTDYEPALTLVGEGVTVHGSIKGVNSMCVDGFVFGDVETDGDFTIGEAGFVRGNVTAGNASVFGRLEGNLRVGASAQISELGQLMGDIECESLLLENGAVFCGTCKMIIKNESFLRKLSHVAAVSEKPSA